MPQQPPTPSQHAVFLNQPAADTAAAAASSASALLCDEGFRRNVGSGPPSTAQGRYQPRTPPVEEDDEPMMVDQGEFGGYSRDQQAQQWEDNRRFPPEVLL
jgi:hypothetical protein